MHIGILKETKANEGRVGLTPAGTARLVREGHTVLCQTGAGTAAGFADTQYVKAGARLATQEAVYAEADMVIHVREPQPEEHALFRCGQIVFAYLHLDAEEALTKALLRTGATGISCDSMRTPQGYRPMVAPMSEIFGRLGILEAARLLESHHGGKGKLLGGMTGVAPGLVIIVGGGTVGLAAARMASGMGARVVLLESSPDRLHALAGLLPANCEVLNASSYDVRDFLPEADVVLGAAGHVAGPAPRVLQRDDLNLMQRGSVLVDIAVDRGGCFETSRKTTHENPFYVENGIIHYCVPNIPAAMPHTATLALTGISLPYLSHIASHGLASALRSYPVLAAGCCTMNGQMTHAEIAGKWNLPCTPLETLLAHEQH